MKVRYLKENFAPIVAESYSYSEVCRKIGLKDKGSNIGTVKKYIELYQLDITHFSFNTKIFSGEDLKIQDFMLYSIRVSFIYFSKYASPDRLF